MRLEKALDILYGELVNTPFISAFSGVTYNVKKVVNGTLFFALNPDDIKRAVANGAYGIVFEGDMVCSDDTEIAWIKVRSIDQSMRRFVRYFLLESKYTLVMLTPIEISLAKSLQIGLSILHSITLQDCLEEIFKLYKDQDKNKDESIQPFCKILLTSIQALENLQIHTCYSVQYARQRVERSRSIFSQHDLEKEIPRRYHKHCSVISYTLFESKIIWENAVYKLSLPYILLPFAESLMATFSFLKQEYWQSYIESMGGLYARESKTTRIVSGKEIKPFNPRLPKYMQGDIGIKGLHVEELSYCYLDSNERLSSSVKDKILLFCTNPSLFACPSLQERDLGYDTEIQNNAHIIFESLRKSRDSNVLMEYLKVEARHLKMLSCYAKGIKLPRTTQKNITIPYAHINHLTQILTKTSYHLAVIYGISKKSFEKNADLPRQSKRQDQKTIHAITQPPDLFSAHGIQI
ncbi:hypothetical protein [Helicobacter bilis]|uniref:Uncharacterized protein n=1 Tax=Helicobacter bilis TaxID=37372 RepID=A0A4U8U8K4_9HELI|nr:hypothetical protein [Helicobacter bilis]TLE10498.1 hypothetical protein LS79_005605 [Helicobacter bilis]